ncbi:MAG: hypothetical protein WCH97_06835, partial [Actinomycetes bacterium]
MTQNDRVLELALHRGDEGFTRLDFLAPTADDGPPIINVPGRIHDLQKKGHAFVSTIDSELKVSRYVYQEVRSVQAVTLPVGNGRPTSNERQVGGVDLSPPLSQPAPNALFDMPVEQPKRADWW